MMVQAGCTFADLLYMTGQAQGGLKRHYREMIDGDDLRSALILKILQYANQID